MAPYEALKAIWSGRGVVVLDGGIGSEIERLGFPRERSLGNLWGILAVYEQPLLCPGGAPPTRRRGLMS